ncbi:hypothetical protein [Sulfobacillus harzensis]|uniref:Lipoprotein n=1 Tax=Sulfobacillus harzensis TaxID=2729629 RepID=A0A7Y0L7D9_9FIRM|nr:hypothetical protein [Sulfobacillus harzensis]NMP23790.1 hypothetical protein [Sulfobacillus harzensis]
MKVWARYGMVLAVATVAAGCGSAAPAASPPAKPVHHQLEAVAVKAGTADVKGQSTRVLVNQKGLTLYYFTKDHGSKSACTGSCTSLWPPLLASQGNVQVGSGVSGKIQVVKDANGDQVSYNMPRVGRPRGKDC